MSNKYDIFAVTSAPLVLGNVAFSFKKLNLEY